jgi:hypothetical protein
MESERWQPPTSPRLRLRLEDARAVEAVGLPVARWRLFQERLHRRLGRGQTVIPVQAEGQGIRPDLPIISLDPLTKGAVDLGVSRAFDVGGRRHLGHVERPGHLPVDVQAADIAPGEYVLVDDDSSSGSTLAFAIASLPPGVRLREVVTLMPRTEDEIADSRDFMLGTDDGGLVVLLPDGSFGRAPYLLPYVDPHARCGVPASDVLQLSIDVWLLNAQAFEGTGTTVAALPVAARRALEAAGFERADSLEDVSRRHAETLRSFVGPGRKPQRDEDLDPRPGASARSEGVEPQPSDS